MSIRKKYWKKVEKCILNGECEKAADMIMAVMTGNVKKAAELYVN